MQALLRILVIVILASQAQALSLAEAFPKLHFKQPVFLTHAGDSSGRVFVVEQGGLVKVVSGGKAKTFLDLSSKVRRDSPEEGLLCIAFHPNFKKNHLIYAIYSKIHSQPRHTVLSSFNTSGTEKVLLEVEKPYPNHNGSTILFGKDGFLYISLGDGGSGGDPHGNAQNLQSLLGKILRIDVDHPSQGRSYGIPQDNPFTGNPAAKPEIFAYGLRNPWRMSMDRVNGELWAGDVGQDKWEEVDLIKKGGNYGWNIKEGSHTFKGEAGSKVLTEPVLDYGRDKGFCVTGGYVYRGKRLPELYGKYIFADYVTKHIWALGLGQSPEEITQCEEPVSSFGEDEAGELYVVGYGGTIYRFQ